MNCKPQLSPLEILYLTSFSLIYLHVEPRKSELKLLTYRLLSMRKAPIDMVSKIKFQSDVKVDNTEELAVSHNSRSGSKNGAGAGGRLQNVSAWGGRRAAPPRGSAVTQLSLT